MRPALRPSPAVMAAVVAVWAGPALASPGTAEPAAAPAMDARTGVVPVPRHPAAPDERLGKKAARIVAKASAPTEGEGEVEVESARARWHAELDRRLGRKPGDIINIYNTWTREFLPVDAAESAVAADAINAFLRCHFTNQPASMDPRLFPTLIRAARELRSRRIDVVSGYRSPKYNLILRKKGREVARDSQHTHGRAVDFRLQGVAAERVLSWARSLRLGGVGYYSTSGFVHIDTDRVRYWTGR